MKIAYHAKTFSKPRINIL